MIIDCHTHLGRNDHINANVKQLLKSMDKAKIDKAMVFAGELNDCPNEWMIEQIKPHRDRLYGVMAYEHPYFRYVDFLKMAQDNNIKAVKFYTGYDHYYPIDLYQDIGEPRTPSSLYHNPIQICSDLGIPAIFHMGDCLNSVKCAKLKYAQPTLIDEPAVDYDDVNFIIAHMAYPYVREAAEVCYKNKNVYSDMSGFVYGSFEGDDIRKFTNSVHTFLDIADNDKLLFGSDWPISDQSSYMKTVQELFETSQCPAAEHLSQNVMKAFRLT